MRYWLVMPAAGAGRRFGDRKPKQYAPLQGRTVIEWSLAPFLADTRAIPSITDMERVNDKLLGAENNLSLATALGSDCGNFADTMHVGANGRPKVRSLLWQYLGLTGH